MWEGRHLPAVGPTEPGTPVNLTEKMGDMLNELEHAHIYIEQLNKKIKLLETLNSTMQKTFENRINKLKGLKNKKASELELVNKRMSEIEKRLAKIES